MTRPIQYINSEEIRQLTDIASLAHAFEIAYGQGFDDVHIPLRTSILRKQPFAVFNAMPAFSHRHQLFVTKLGAVVPQPDSSLPSVHAIIIAFSGQTGKPLAMLDGDAITQCKCAAITALVTDRCALPHANVLAIIGSGVQAREQIKGVSAVRTLKQIRVYSRHYDHVIKFIRHNAHLCSQAEMIACSSADNAIETADIISTATTSADPVILAQALENKLVHINCMGNHNTQSREIPLSILQHSLLVVEDIITAVAEAGDVHLDAMTIEKLIKHDTLDLQRQRTIFSSTGHAFLDLVTVSYFLARLRININH
jgi:ornithine cyclodeaminase/alanine dehydrogenase-like protein (mu-crystallin family)